MRRERRSDDPSPPAPVTPSLPRLGNRGKGDGVKGAVIIAVYKASGSFQSCPRFT
jgi:hypothetical protein